MSLAQDHLDAIIAAVLAVNAYGLEKAYALLPEFRKLGLTNPEKVAQADIAEVMTWLNQAGYHRGMLAEMMAGRLISLMIVVAEGKLDRLNSFVSKGNEEGATELLCQVKGIGPKVAMDVWMLVRTKTPKTESRSSKSK